MTPGLRATLARSATALLALAAALMAAPGCSREARVDDRTREPAPPPPRRGANILDAAPAPPPTDADTLADCVAACVRSRQAEAIAIDVIRRTCAHSCAL